MASHEKEIGQILKQYRKSMKLSIGFVSEHLSNKGYPASMKAMYSWERGDTLPRLDVFLELCGLYGITDIPSTFNFVDYTISNQIEEHQRTIRAYVIE